MQTKDERIKYLVGYLNKCCDEYYNGNNPSLSDAEYDSLFDELTALEKKTGTVLANSPTNRAGYEAISELQKVKHPIELLSLAKTKKVEDIADMLSRGKGFLSLKLDGLTVELDYIDGRLSEASTRGDGSIGEIITHNARVFTNIPLTVPFTEPLTVTGEALIDIPTFRRINESIDNDEDKYSTPRNLASGSVRQLDSRICSERKVKYFPFNVLKGIDDEDTKSGRLDRLVSMGFASNFREYLDENDTVETITEKIFKLKSEAEKAGLPIDGIVFSYDDVAFAKAQGKTAHHFRDGIAYKFGDPTAETVFKSTEWNISRTGQLTPVAVFDPVEIDNTKVERASLHNITFIENLCLNENDRILVSKRNMIIPHVEKNLSAEETAGKHGYNVCYPKVCPVCGYETKVSKTQSDGKTVSVLYCGNEKCPGRQIKKYVHFVSKQALNIEGLSEATLEKFVSMGFITCLSDIFDLARYRGRIITLNGFGEKSYKNLSDAIEKARVTTLERYLVAMNIPLVGKSAASDIAVISGGSPEHLLEMIDSGYNFSDIDGFGEIMNETVREWFADSDNRNEFSEIAKLLEFEKPAENSADKNGQFYGKTVVITGTFGIATRDELTKKLTLLGAKVTGSVSGKTDFVLCGENAGSKLDKAKKLGVTIITENELTELP